MPKNSSASSSGYTCPKSLRARESAWPMSGVSLPVTAAGPGPRAGSMREPHSTLHCPGKTPDKNMTELKPILLAEDNARDVEMTLSALKRNNVANEIVVV